MIRESEELKDRVESKRHALQARLAALEGAEAALVLASGMGAIATAILTVCGSGDHLVAARSLYGGTHRLLDVELPRLGIQVTYAGGVEVEAWEQVIRPETRLLLWEAISNPLLRVPDTPALAALSSSVTMLPKLPTPSCFAILMSLPTTPMMDSVSRSVLVVRSGLIGW